MPTGAARMRLLERIRASFLGHPVAWCLAVLLVLMGYRNYQRGRDLSHLCDVVGSHIITVAHARTLQQEIERVCLDREPDEDR